MYMTDGQVIVITGSSSGFGRKTAERFAKAGWRVYATMRESTGRHADAAARLSALGMSVVDLDVTHQDSVDRAASEILSAVDGVDVLFNNAGVSYLGPTEAFTVDAVKAQFDLNVFGALRVNRAFLPSMRGRGKGLIVYTSSVTGRIVFPASGVYCASKFATEAFAQALSYEVGPVGIDVAIVEPGAFSTNIANSRVAPDDAERLSAYAHLRATSSALGAMLSSDAKGRDAGDVAEEVFRLASMSPGSRPLRSPVPADGGLDAINAVSLIAQEAALAPLQAGASGK
jgi:NAD(P)-dependent dehydrogenase (short-subunit alcohol dehydrogenase family)